MSKEHDIYIGQFAVSIGIISAQQLSVCLKLQAQYHQNGEYYSLLDILRHKNFISQSQIHILQKTTTGEGNQTLSANQVPLKIANRYQVLQELGRGGMGIVYRAQDEVFEREVAIKILRNFDGNHKMSARFLREAKAMAKLKHPNIVEIYDIGMEKDFHYFTMEYVKGKNLRTLMQSKKISVREAAKITIKILNALQHAHSNGIIHRDIKPDNIMISDKNVKVMDFGLAKMVEEKVRISQTGNAVGTVHYMSPEQMLAQRSKISYTTDIYSTGVTLYEILTGRTPFVAKSFAEAVKKINRPFTTPHEIKTKIPRQLSAICMKALQKKISKRYQSAEMFLEDLQNFVQSKQNVHAVRHSSRTLPIFGVIILCAICLLTLPLLSNKNKSETVRKVAPQKKTPTILYRGNLRRTGFYNTKPLTNVSQIRWSLPTKKRIKSSPVVSDNIVYFAGYTHKVYALGVQSGKTIWEFTANDLIYSSPAIYDNVLYIGSHDGYMYALEKKNGTLIWKFRAQDSILSSPAFNEGMVYFASHDHKIYAVNARTGKEVWSHKTGDKILSSPAIFDKTLFIGCNDGFLYAIKANSGELRWRFATNGVIKSVPAIDDNAVYFGSFDHHVYAVSHKGELLWRFKTGAEIHSSAAIKELIYVGSNDGYFYALDKNTGKLKWRNATKSPVVMSPCIFNNVLYYSSLDGFLYCAYRRDGRILWRQKLNCTFSSPTIGHNTLFCGGIDGTIYAVD
ncbi:beta-alanine-activating enzyme beta-propeller domain-containing protein [Candidatus Uabimicrobium amorphum]|uniref:non-specific serine/threonine protein kinase n=1 Tax=Uabimicrobium amorphum TaxID=2596890 RepID=A0A5S9F1Y3_UABAM|nr:PQQ-binding-like beta-propeller repeat protein [Candidatus Uabimicrobium amorphum]BBM82892.1 protein kinase [Candidatus Uabimicrobium amorphum]